MQDLHRAPRLPRSTMRTPLSAGAGSLVLNPVLARVAPRVYLAGPIKGLQYDDAVTWRQHAADDLAPEIVAYSPMRGKSTLRNSEPLGAEYLDESGSLLISPAAIYGRDHNDVATADLVIAYLVGASTVSIGTVSEIAWCHAYRKPLVVVEVEGGLHWHPFVTQPALTVVGSIEDAIKVARSVLLP